MTGLAKSIKVLADQLNRLEQVPQSDRLRHTIQEFPGMMEEVVDFIQKWLEHWTRMYNLSGMVPSLNCRPSQVYPRCGSKGKSGQTTKQT